jgi:O-antigen/teichoic acid export membrane protein
VLRKVLSYGIYSFFSRIAYLLSYQSDRVVMGAVIGISSVTYYVVPFTLVSRVTNITVRIGSVIFPAISELQGHDRFDTITRLYLISSRIILIISTTICLPLVLFGDRFLTLWMGPAFGNRASLVLVLLTIGLFFNSLTNIPSFVADGLGKPKLTGVAGVTAAILNVGLLIPLTSFYGILCAAIAFLISNSLVCPLFVWYVNDRVLQLPMGLYLREVCLRPVAAALITVLPFLFIPEREVRNIYLLITLMGAVSSVYLLVSYLVGALPQELLTTVLNKFKKLRVSRPDYVSQ